VPGRLQVSLVTRFTREDPPEERRSRGTKRESEPPFPSISSGTWPGGGSDTGGRKGALTLGAQVQCGQVPLLPTWS